MAISAGANETQLIGTLSRRKVETDKFLLSVSEAPQQWRLELSSRLHEHRLKLRPAYTAVNDVVTFYGDVINSVVEELHSALQDQGGAGWSVWRELNAYCWLIQSNQFAAQQAMIGSSYFSRGIYSFYFSAQSLSCLSHVGTQTFACIACRGQLFPFKKQLSSRTARQQCCRYNGQ